MRSARVVAVLVAAVVSFCAAPPTALALGPHEILLLVNSNSAASREIANRYAALRKVPSANIVYLDAPASNAALSPDDFRRRILDPAMTLARAHRVGDHVLAWIYSADFPTSVDGPVRMSLHGATFVRGNLPDREKIARGLWSSPLFRGPAREGAPQGPSCTLEQFAMVLGTNLPLPAMSLAVVGGGSGMTVAQAFASLSNAAAADATRPSGAFNFVTNADVRSTARTWQLDNAAQELRQSGFTVLFTAGTPVKDRPLLGILAGMARLDGFEGARLVRGSVADHLTSFAAVFEQDAQSRLTDWIKAGAAASSGTVTEPGSLQEPVLLWAKFPHARFFVHYTAGCSVLESYAQSVACPLQLMLVGDPLCRPFARPEPVTLVCVSDEGRPLSGEAVFSVVAWADASVRQINHLLLLDGRALPMRVGGGTFKVDTARLPDGWHQMRVVSYAGQPVCHQSFCDLAFSVNNRGRSVTLHREDATAKDEVAFTATAVGAPRSVYVEVQGDRACRATSSVARVSIPADRYGPGPVRVQARAVYPDGEEVLSEPLVWDIAEKP